MPPIPQVTVSPLALDTCRLIGANPAGPVGARLIEACGALPPQRTLATGAEREALVSMLIDGATNRETYFFRDRRQLALMGALLRDTAPAGRAADALVGGLRHRGGGLFPGDRPAGTRTARRRDRHRYLSRGRWRRRRAALYRTGQMSPCREVRAEDETFLPSHPDGRRAVADPIRSAVRFLEHNILSGPPPQPQRFDAVVCRNVLIYMDAASRSAALLVLSNAVKPGSLLLLGPGDVAPPVDPVALGFRAVFRDGAGVFIKGDADGR